MPKEVEDIMAQKLMLLVNNHFYIEMVNLPFAAMDICEKLGICRTKWVAARKWVSNFCKRHPSCPHVKVAKSHVSAPFTSTSSVILSGTLP